MLEAQLGVMPMTGKSTDSIFLHSQLKVPPDDLSFTIVLELNDDGQPSATEGKVSEFELKNIPSSSLLRLLKDPPPWIPAVTSHTTSATSDCAETHLVRAVNTGIIDVSFRLSGFKTTALKIFAGRSGCSRVGGEVETIGSGTGRSKSETEGHRKGERA